MSLIPKKMPHVAHPFISSVYLKENHRAGLYNDRTLIVEVNINKKTAESDYQDLLTELPSLRARAESYFGHFRNIDIRMPSLH